MWTYRQRTGELLRDGRLVGLGYSGAGAGKNDPAAQDQHSVGPIPRGRWQVAHLLEQTDTHGPFVLQLVPEYGVETFGRSGFLIHGDSIKAPGTASKGCIILNRATREAIWASQDRHIEVVA